MKLKKYRVFEKGKVASGKWSHYRRCCCNFRLKRIVKIKRKSGIVFKRHVFCSITTLLVGEKLPLEAEIEVSVSDHSHIKNIFFLIFELIVFLLGRVVAKAFWCLFQDDPFKLKTGGIVNMKKVKDRNRDM